ncbi:MAG: adenosylcobinamide-GDP ribazoletransferase [Desulfotignum sp.]|nr:adenosylcobinamide-GDP ribazoletransferase [Desulfotignum sp.]MCF8112552.1 adenosylcobinamide-GDP ribazoletransferase [Desulfotignum sp.]
MTIFSKTNRFLADLRSCLLFLTILPAGRGVVYSPMGMIRFFPVTGLILGSLMVLTDLGASLLWPMPVVALMDLICLLVLTGAFHLDGLGDTADGIFSHRPREQALAIMKDSRTGMMGLVAVVCVLGMKLAGIYAVKAGSGMGDTLLIFLLVPAYARASMILGIRFLNYGRKGTGTGLDLFAAPLGAKDFIYCVIPLCLSLFLGYKGLVLNLVFAITCLGILWFYKKKMNCITGDMLGAMTELQEAVLFLACGTALV